MHDEAGPWRAAHSLQVAEVPGPSGVSETERIRTRIIRMPKTMPLYVSDWPQDADTGTVTGDEKSIPPAL